MLFSTEPCMDIIVGKSGFIYAFQCNIFDYFLFPMQYFICNNVFHSNTTRGILWIHMASIYKQTVTSFLISLAELSFVSLSYTSFKIFEETLKIIFQITIQFKVIVLYVLNIFAPQETHIMVFPCNELEQAHYFVRIMRLSDNL
jgi:hypothetical protein